MEIPGGKYQIRTTPYASDYAKYELNIINKLNDKVMSRVGHNPQGSLRNPPFLDSVSFDNGNNSVVSQFVADIPKFPFAVKDPRFCFTWKQWSSQLTAHEVPHLMLFSVRDPLENAYSLLSRNWVPSVRAGLELWLRYSLSILECLEQLGGKTVLFKKLRPVDTFELTNHPLRDIILQTFSKLKEYHV